MAAEHYCPRVAEVLIRSGADVHAKDNHVNFTLNPVNVAVHTSIISYTL